MKFKTVLTGCAIATLGCWSFCALAGEEYAATYSYIESDWFTTGASIQDLRERSTNSFELLDENQSGSITMDEIDLTQMESEIAQMKPEELRQYRRRSSVIHSKFMSWSTEFDEFEVVDTNNDGVWTKDEFEVRNENLQRHRLELGLQEWDTDGNDAVELHEFNGHLDELELLDEDADGTVSHKEAFKSKDKKVISDVLLNKLKIDGAIWTQVEGMTEDVKGEATGTRYRFYKQKEADDINKQLSLP